MTDHHRQPGHPYATVVGFIDNRGPAQQRNIIGIVLLHGFQKIVINLENNLQMARQDFPQHLDRPGLQRLAHQGMVGVGEDLTGHPESVIPAEAVFVNQQTHQLRDRQHRMGVVEVDSNFICQVVIGLIQLVMAKKNILHRRRNEEIFLTQAQLAPGVGRVVRIQYPGDVFGMVFIFYRREVISLIKFTEVNLAAGLGAPQAQGVGGIGFITRDNLIVGHRDDLFGFQPARVFPLMLGSSQKTENKAR